MATIKFKLDPRITGALGDLIAGIASTAADAALGEVQDRIREGVSKVDLGLSKTRTKVRAAAKKQPAKDANVVDAEFEEERKH